MKKTEKIEVRISPEEKAALSQISAEDGRSVSEIVRGFVGQHVSERREAAIETQRRKEMGLLHYAAVLGVGLIAGAGGLYAAEHSISRETVLGVEIRLVAQDERGQFHEYEVSSTIPIDYEEPAQIRIPAAEGAQYQVAIDLAKGNQDAMNVSFDLCLQTQSGCEPLARPELIAHKSKPLRVEFVTDDDLHVNIRLHPKRA